MRQYKVEIYYNSPLLTPIASYFNSIDERSEFMKVHLRLYEGLVKEWKYSEVEI